MSGRSIPGPGGRFPASEHDHFRARADAARRQADKTPDPNLKAALEAVAAEWLRLAADATDGGGTGR